MRPSGHQLGVLVERHEPFPERSTPGAARFGDSVLRLAEVDRLLRLSEEHYVERRPDVRPIASGAALLEGLRALRDELEA